MSYASGENAIYCGDRAGDRVDVIDGAANYVNALIPTPFADPVLLCYNQEYDRLYCTDDYRGLTAIDCRADTVMATRTTDYFPGALCMNTTDNKVYIGTAVSIMVVDCASGSVVADISTQDGTMCALCYNEALNSIYCALNYNTSGGVIVAIDGATNGVTADHLVRVYPVSLCHNLRDNKLYVGHGTGFVTVMDCARDSVVAVVSSGSGTVSLCYNLQNDRVYAANSGSNTVTVIDGATNQLRATLPVGIRPGPVCYNPVDNNVYCVNQSNSVSVIDGARDSVVLTIPVGTSPVDIVCDSAENRVYVANGGSASVSVIHGGTPGGVEEAGRRARSRGMGATVLRVAPAGELFDAQGRRVTEPKSGVYFVRAAGTARVRKVIIAR